MIYEASAFGQTRERRGVTVPRGEAPEGEIPRDVAPEPTGYIEAAQLIASSVLSAMASGYGVTADQAIRMASAQMNPAQRFYEVEFHQAAILLAQSYPALQVNAWLLQLGNNMGWRKVVMPICRYGEVVDPLTRACVAEAVRIPEVPERIADGPEERPEEKREEEKAFEVPLWAWGVGAGLAVLVLMGMGGRR